MYNGLTFPSKIECLNEGKICLAILWFRVMDFPAIQIIRSNNSCRNCTRGYVAPLVFVFFGYAYCAEWQATHHRVQSLLFLGSLQTLPWTLKTVTQRIPLQDKLLLLEQLPLRQLFPLVLGGLETLQRSSSLRIFWSAEGCSKLTLVSWLRTSQNTTTTAKPFPTADPRQRTLCSIGNARLLLTRSVLLSLDWRSKHWACPCRPQN